MFALPLSGWLAASADGATVSVFGTVSLPRWELALVQAAVRPHQPLERNVSEHAGDREDSENFMGEVHETLGDMLLIVRACMSWLHSHTSSTGAMGFSSECCRSERWPVIVRRGGVEVREQEAAYAIAPWSWPGEANSQRVSGTTRKCSIPIEGGAWQDALLRSTALSQVEQMNTIQPHRAGLVIAILLGGWHLMWSLLVAVGWAQPLIDFIFWIHFIKPVYTIEPFNIGIALLLVGVTSTIGYALGWGFGVLWNRLHK